MRDASHGPAPELNLVLATQALPTTAYNLMRLPRHVYGSRCLTRKAITFPALFPPFASPDGLPMEIHKW